MERVCEGSLLLEELPSTATGDDADVSVFMTRPLLLLVVDVGDVSTLTTLVALAMGDVIVSVVPSFLASLLFDASTAAGDDADAFALMVVFELLFVLDMMVASMP